MTYNYVLVTRQGGIGDLLMLEPTIEALYYRHAPARIILRTHPLYEGILSDHPLIWKHIYDDTGCNGYGLVQTGMVQTSLNGLLPTDTSLHCYNFIGGIEANYGLHGVDAFAAVAGVTLLRRTPSMGTYDLHSSGKVVVQLRNRGDGRDLLMTDLPPLPNDTIFLSSDALSSSPNQEYVNTIGSADMFIGPDSSGLHIAHACGVRKIVGLYTPNYPYWTRAYPGVVTTTNVTELQDAINSLLNEAKYPAFLNEGRALEGIRAKALAYCRGRGLDVGSSEWPLPGALALPTENERHLFDQGPFDFIFSSHCLEHIDDWQSELKLWAKSVRPGGTVFIYVPHPSMEPWRPGGEWVGHWHRWSPSPVTLVKWLMENTDLKVEEYSCYPDSYWSFHIIARRKG